jgi:hypothetical protein
MDAQIRERLLMAGLTAADLAWLDSFGWSDSQVPQPRPDEIDDYRRREAALNAIIAPLSFAERGESIEGRLAAMIGARAADALERDEDE